jgi:hypothetical protein
LAFSNNLLSEPPQDFVVGHIQKAFDAGERRAVEVVGFIEQAEQPINGPLPLRFGLGANPPYFCRSVLTGAGWAKAHLGAETAPAAPAAFASTSRRLSSRMKALRSSQRNLRAIWLACPL